MLKLSQSLQPTLRENVNLVQVVRRKGKAAEEQISCVSAYFTHLTLSDTHFFFQKLAYKYSSVLKCEHIDLFMLNSRPWNDHSHGSAASLLFD